MEFKYINNTLAYERSLYGKRLMDLECKHTVNYNNKESNEVYYKYIIGGHFKVQWGAYRGGNIETEQDILLGILDSIKKNRLRPIRIVIDVNGNVWADNTHWTIAYILKYGENVLIKDIPFYVVDFYTEEVPIIASHEGSVIKSVDSIIKAINQANKLNTVVLPAKTQLNINWTIGNLLLTILDERKGIKL